MSSGKSSSEGSPADQGETEQSIRWEYLTYETELPTPPIHPASNTAAPERPPPPDLRKLEDPMKWSYAQKQSLLWQSCIGTALTSYAAGTYAPAIDQMAAEWHISTVAAEVGITTFTLGFAIAPMILAPFSEINGRRPVFVIAGCIFVVCVACCSATQIFAGMLVARFFGGCASSVFSTMVGGVVADIYDTYERNTPMAIFSGGVLFGTGFGPLIGGFIAQHTSWRWVFGAHAISLALFMVVLVFFFRETRGSVLLSRKAKRLNEWYQACDDAGYIGVVFPAAAAAATGDEKTAEPQRIRWKVKSDEERASIATMIKVSATRPFILLFTEPVVFFFSLWVSFSWSILYLLFSVIPYIFETVYGFSLEKSNAVFAVVSIAGILFTPVSIYQEKLARRLGKMGDSPESRLWFSAFESPLLPIGLFWVGWTSSVSIPWIVPALGIAAAVVGIFSIYLATFNYLADTYHRYASSAIAGQSFCRNVLGGAFPIFAQAFFQNVGIGPAASILGGIGVLLTLVPWVLALYGPRIRARSKFASEIMK